MRICGASVGAQVFHTIGQTCGGALRASCAGFGSGASPVGAIRNITRAIAVAATSNRTIRLRSAAIDYGSVTKSIVM